MIQLPDSLTKFLAELEQWPGLAAWFSAVGTWAAAIMTYRAVRVALLQDPRARLHISADSQTGLLIEHIKPIAFPPKLPPDAGWRGQDGITTHFFILRIRNTGRGRATAVQVHVTAVQNLETGDTLLREDKPAPSLRWAHSWWLFTDVGQTLADAPQLSPILSLDIPAGNSALCDLGFVIESNSATEGIGFRPNTLLLSAAAIPHPVQIGVGRWLVRTEVFADNAAPQTVDLYVDIQPGGYDGGPKGVAIQPMSQFVRLKSALLTPSSIQRKLLRGSNG